MLRGRRIEIACEVTLVSMARYQQRAEPPEQPRFGSVSRITPLMRTVCHMTAVHFLTTRQRARIRCQCAEARRDEAGNRRHQQVTKLISRRPAGRKGGSVSFQDCC